MGPDWTEGMLTQIARDLELVKAALGIDRNEVGDIVRVIPPFSEDAKAVAERVMGSPPPGYDPGCQLCTTDNHRCPGCGTPTLHGRTACTTCARL